MFNMVLGDFHPSTICVERSGFPASLKGLLSLASSEYVEESLKEYIEEYARTDEILPEDRTIGFVVFNLPKKVASVSISTMNEEEASTLNELKGSLTELGFKFELDAPA